MEDSNALKPSAIFHPLSSRFAAFAGVCLAISLAGCASPSAANNKLRVENQALREQVEHLKQEHDADVASLRAMESKVGTVATLPRERLDKLFTVYGIKLGKLTGGDDWDADKPGDDGIKVAVTPLDQQGDKLKAAGSFAIDLFDLESPTEPHIGHWTFDAIQSRQNWYGALLYSYVFKCPWQKTPLHNELTVRVTFSDELTGRQYNEQQVCKVNLPGLAATPPTPPTTQPHPRP